MNPEADPGLPVAAVEITLRGHPGVTAADLHAWEILDAAEWTERPGAVGYAASYDPTALLALRGRVQIELTCGGAVERLEGTISATYQRGGPLVFRRDTRTQTRPFAWQCSKAAADFDRSLVAALREPGSVGRVTLTPLPGAEVPPGALVLVGMPIGHQGDLAPRALDALLGADVILAEDTRVAEKALRWRGVFAPVESCHEHNERGRVPGVLARLERGQRVALVTDAGMPLVSDPGYSLVQAAVEAGGHVTAVPGPSATLLALVLSGLPTARFRFTGFPPRKAGERKRFAQAALESDETSVFFESAHRVREFVADLAEAAPERRMALCKDLTKRTEKVTRGTCAEVAESLAVEAEPRGEFTVVVAPRPESASQDGDEATKGDGAGLGIEAFVKALLAEGCPTAPIAKAWHRLAGIPRDEAYARVQVLAGKGPK